MIPAILIGIALPLVFLALVQALDLYASGSFTTVLLACAGGLASFGMAYLINSAAANIWPFIAITLVIAPIAEEILKATVLFHLVRRSDFTYFVDGAIYGFAAGTAFAALENPLYVLHQSHGGLGLVLMRGFSTSLMHGTASALVGVSLGRFRFARGVTRIASTVVGLSAAIVLHAGFNRAAYLGIGGAWLPLALGVGGAFLVVGFIFWGLREERGWLEETLGLRLGVTKGEAAVVLKLEDLEALLEPITARFGAEKRERVEDFLRLQAQLGLKSKALAMAREPALCEELTTQVGQLREQQDTIRRQMGVYCMAYVRSILPPKTTLIWDRLAEEVARERTPTQNLWGSLGGKMNDRLQ